METVLRPFVNRFAQPILLSFCIAWIFWNWEIVVGVIWYNGTTLIKVLEVEMSTLLELGENDKY